MSFPSLEAQRRSGLRWGKSIFPRSARFAGRLSATAFCLPGIAATNQAERHFMQAGLWPTSIKLLGSFHGGAGLPASTGGGLGAYRVHPGGRLDTFAGSAAADIPGLLRAYRRGGTQTRRSCRGGFLLSQASPMRAASSRPRSSSLRSNPCRSARPFLAVGVTGSNDRRMARSRFWQQVAALCLRRAAVAPDVGLRINGHEP